MVVFDVTMKQGIRSDYKSQADHSPFKKCIVNDINPKNRQGGDNHRQQGTMNGTGYRRSNTHYIPIDFCIHFWSDKDRIFAIGLQLLNSS